MSSAHERPSRFRVAAKVVRIAYVLAFASMAGYVIGDRRGWVLGSLAFLLYGSVTGVVALSFPAVRRWSAEHVVLDSLLFVPLLFFGLLLIPALSWWAAALIALGIGAVVVPWMVRRRAVALARRTAVRTE